MKRSHGSLAVLILILLVVCVPALAQGAGQPDSVSPVIQAALEPLFVKVMELLITVIGVGVVWLLKRLISYLKVHLNAAQLVFVKAIFNEAVKTAEQLGVANTIANTAEAKKLYATDLVTKKLAKAGLYTLANDVKGISDGLEAAVMEQFNQGKAGVLAEWSNIELT